MKVLTVLLLLIPSGIKKGGSIMSKKKKIKNEFNAVPPYAQIEEKLAYSEASKGLKAHTKWLYVAFRLKYKGNNARDIVFLESEAKKIMSLSTFRADCRKLIERGFIDLIKRGGFYNQPHIFGLSNRWRKYGTKDFIKIDVNKIFPKIFKRKFKKGHKFMGNQFKKKEHL